MVSYYNSLSTMFPPHHAAAQPHSVAASALAARHAASYFQGYHHPPYGYPQHHQFPPTSISPGNSTVPTSSTTPTGSNLSGQYPSNLSDLNSNVCGGAGVPPLSGPGFVPSHHQHLEAGSGFQPNPAITPPSWHTAQPVWHPNSPFWAGSCNVPAAGQGMEGLLQQQSDIISSIPSGQLSTGARSPNTPPRGSSDGPGMRGPSPGYPNGSHSSGSPNATPTPAGIGYSSEFNDYSSYHLQQQQQQQLQQHQQQQQLQHQQQLGEESHDEDEEDGRDSPLSPPSANSSLRPQPARSPYEWMKKPSYQSQPDKSGVDILGRTRTKDKYRVVYSDHQRLELEKEFHYSRYITIRRKAELANSVGLSERQVKIWFQNRRAKERRALKKHEDVIIKEKIESVSFGAMSYSDAMHHSGNLGSCHSTNAMVMMGGHGMPGHFAPQSLSSSLMSGSPQLSLPMKFE